MKHPDIITAAVAFVAWLLWAGAVVYTVYKLIRIALPAKYPPAPVKQDPVNFCRKADGLLDVQQPDTNNGDHTK